jgi:hypothetical protein
MKMATHTCYTPRREAMDAAQKITMPVISTAHLDEQTAAAMSAQGSKSPWCTVVSWEYGFFAYLEELVMTDTPKCLVEVCEWLAEEGYTDCWVRFDCDAAPVEGLPTYDW